MTVSTDRRIRNEKIRAIRVALNMSQTEFATAIRAAGNESGDRNGCTKRLVQKWEAGEHAVCKPHYRRALQRVKQVPYSDLGFRDSASAVINPGRRSCAVSIHAGSDIRRAPPARDSSPQSTTRRSAIHHRARPGHSASTTSAAPHYRRHPSNDGEVP